MTLCWCGSLTLKFGIKQVVEGQIATLNITKLTFIALVVHLM